MKSLNKHVPALVFLVGLSLLVYSVRTFFNPAAFTRVTPIVNGPSAARSKSEPKPPAAAFKPSRRPPPVVSRTDPREEIMRIMREPAEAYLSRVGLKMRIPESMAFITEKDGPVEVLIGASAAGKSDFYMFSAKGKYKVERVNQYIKEYFAEDGVVAPRPGGQGYSNRGGFSDMVQLRGSSGRGEYQAFFFSNGKTNQSHLVLLLNKQFLKSPARVRELVDSISRSK